MAFRRPSRKAAVAATRRLNGDNGIDQSSGSEDDGSRDDVESWGPSPRKAAKKSRLSKKSKTKRRSVVGSDDEVYSGDEDEAGWDSDNVVSDEESLGSDEDEDETAEFDGDDDNDDDNVGGSEESDGDGDGDSDGARDEPRASGAKRPRSSSGQSRNAQMARSERRERRAAARDGPRPRRGGRPPPAAAAETLTRGPAPNQPDEPTELGWKAKGHSLIGLRYCRTVEGEPVYGTIRKWLPAVGSAATAGGGHLFRAVDDSGDQEDLDQEEADEAVEAYDDDAYDAHRRRSEGGGGAEARSRGARARAREEREAREEEEGALDLKEWRPQGGEKEGQRALAFALGECERIGSTLAARLEAMGLVAAGGCLGSSSLSDGGRGGRSRGEDEEEESAAAEGEEAKPVPMQQPSSMAAVGADGERLGLSEYQLVGLNWLLAMKKLQLGCILADDMGLGKTVQVLALFAALAEAAKAEGIPVHGTAAPVHLVIAPSSVLDNWARELARWCPGLRAAKYHGPAAERKAMQKTLDTRGFDVLITSYTYFEGDDEAQRGDRAWLRQREYDVLVIDEAHALKRHGSRRGAL